MKPCKFTPWSTIKTCRVGTYTLTKKQTLQKRNFVPENDSLSDKKDPIFFLGEDKKPNKLSTKSGCLEVKKLKRRATLMNQQITYEESNP